VVASAAMAPVRASLEVCKREPDVEWMSAPDLDEPSSVGESSAPGEDRPSGPVMEREEATEIKVEV